MKLTKTRAVLDALRSSGRADVELIALLIEETLDFDLEEEAEKKEEVANFPQRN